MGQLLVTSWALPGEGTDAIRGTVAELRGPARPGLHGADGCGWPARCGCRKVPGTRLASGTPTSDTQKPDSPSQGQNVPAPGLPTHCLSPPHSSGMLTGTLPGNQMPACCYPSAAFQQHLCSPWISVLCLPILQTPCSELRGEAMGPSEPSRATRDVGRSWGMLASAYKEPQLTCSPWSPRNRLVWVPVFTPFTSGETEAQSGYTACLSSCSTRTGSQAAGPEPWCHHQIVLFLGHVLVSCLLVSSLLGMKMVIPTSPGPGRSRPCMCERVSQPQPCGRSWGVMVGGRPVHRRVFSRVCGLPPLDVSGNAPSPSSP